METCENESSEKTSLRRGYWGYGLSPRHPGGIDFPPGLPRILPPSRKFPQASEDFTTEVEIPSGKQQKATNYIYTPLPPNDPIRSRYRTRLSVRNPVFCNACLLVAASIKTFSLAAPPLSSPGSSHRVVLHLRCCVVSACLQPKAKDRPNAQGRTKSRGAAANERV